MTNKVYDVITDRILEALDQGTIPWRRPWTAGIPRNATNNRPYHGINAVLLGMTAYQDQRWLTYKQAVQLGGHVRRGERSTMVVFWKQHTVGDDGDDHDGLVEERPRTIPLLRVYHVFNALDQCDGLSLTPMGVTPTVEPIAAARAIVNNMPNPPRIDHDGGNRAYYRPSTDSIHMPAVNDFHGAGEYHATLFHELSHSTGHASRLSRESLETPAPFGSEIYSREELVAEFGAAFLCATAGIDNALDNSASYINGWAKALQADHRLVITAASQGQRAADFIIGGA